MYCPLCCPPLAHHRQERERAAEEASLRDLGLLPPPAPADAPAGDPPPDQSQPTQPSQQAAQQVAKDDQARLYWQLGRFAQAAGLSTSYVWAVAVEELQRLGAAEQGAARAALEAQLKELMAGGSGGEGGLHCQTGWGRVLYRRCHPGA